MTRSIRWISSSAPSLLCSSGCVALPQPRSRMALAAETRAAGVASLFRMILARTAIADLVWLRARERISVSDLLLLKGAPHGNADQTGQRERDQVRCHQSSPVN